MKTLGVYEVVSKLAFRGHAKGTVFTDYLNPMLEARSLSRGRIRLIERIPADLPARWGLPGGWV